MEIASAIIDLIDIVYISSKRIRVELG